MNSKKVTTNTIQEKDASGQVVKTIITTTEEVYHNAVSNKKTYALFILDKSGSMSFGQESTMSQYNNNLGILTDKKAELGSVFITTIYFDDTVKFQTQNSAVESVPRLNSINYVPGGNTALNDAIGAAINFGRDNFTDINQPDVAVLVNIFTDGQENHSKVYSTAQIKNLIAEMEKTGKWTFTTVAPEYARESFVRDYGISKGNFSGFDPMMLSSRFAAGASNSAGLAAYASVRSLGGTQTANFFSGTKTHEELDALDKSGKSSVKIDQTATTK